MKDQETEQVARLHSRKESVAFAWALPSSTWKKQLKPRKTRNTRNPKDMRKEKASSGGWQFCLSQFLLLPRISRISRCGLRDFGDGLEFEKRADFVQFCTVLPRSTLPVKFLEETVNDSRTLPSNFRKTVKFGQETVNFSVNSNFGAIWCILVRSGVPRLAEDTHGTPRLPGNSNWTSPI